MRNRQHVIWGYLWSIAIIYIILLFLSCDTIKNKSTRETKIDSTSESSSERISYRKGDSIVFVPRVKFKDTTIVRTSIQGTTIRTIYDKDGNVKQVDCYASLIQDIFRENQRLALAKEEYEKTKDKTTEFKTDWIIWLIVGVMVFVLIMFFVMWTSMKKQISTVTQFIPKKD